MNVRSLKVLAPVILCLLVSGCTKKEVNNETVVHCYQSWVGFVGIAVGLAATALGWFLRGSFRGIIFFIMTILGTLLFSPFGFFDHVTVSPDRIVTHWGCWCFPTVHDIPFDQVSGVSLTKKTSVRRRGRETSYNLEFQLRDGRMESLTATNDLMEAAADDLMLHLAEHGIAVANLTGE